MQKSRIINVCLNAFVIIALLLSILTSTLAYFKFSTYFFGEGTLPLMKLYANVSNINGSGALKRINYIGQTSENIEVSFNTNGNNIAGKLRVIVYYVWQDNLSNTPINDDNETIISIKAKLYDETLFNVQNNNEYYLIQPFEPNNTLNFMSGIEFSNLPSEYMGKFVDIYIIADLIQENKEW